MELEYMKLYLLENEFAIGLDDKNCMVATRTDCMRGDINGIIDGVKDKSYRDFDLDLSVSFGINCFKISGSISFLDAGDDDELLYNLMDLANIHYNNADYPFGFSVIEHIGVGYLVQVSYFDRYDYADCDKIGWIIECMHSYVAKLYGDCYFAAYAVGCVG